MPNEALSSHPKLITTSKVLRHNLQSSFANSTWDIASNPIIDCFAKHSKLAMIHQRVCDRKSIKEKICSFNLSKKVTVSCLENDTWLKIQKPSIGPWITSEPARLHDPKVTIFTWPYMSLVFRQSTESMRSWDAAADTKPKSLNLASRQCLKLLHLLIWPFCCHSHHQTCEPWRADATVIGITWPISFNDLTVRANCLVFMIGLVKKAYKIALPLATTHNVFLDTSRGVASRISFLETC